MKIAILGYGVQGKSSYEYWNKPSNEITICDFNTDVEIPEGAKSQLGENYLDNLEQFDLLVRISSLHPRDIEAKYPPEILDKVTSNTNEFFKVCPSRHIIGVTGTKGKGTTSTLIAKMLEAAGKRVHIGGNIGTPPLDMLKNDIKSEDYVVLELANFQLIDLKYSPHIAVVLMVEPEHMDWHTDMDEYVRAKQQLFVHQKSNDIAIYYGQNENSKHVAEVSPGVLVPYMSEPGAVVENTTIKLEGQGVCETSELKLLGRHNWQNVCAAVTAVWQVEKNIEAIHSVLTNFAGLEHRLQFVRDFEGVRYYDDSFGTTPETAQVAIEAFAEPKVVILGGSSKNASFEKLAETVVSNNVRQVILVGNTKHPRYKTAAPDIEAALRSHGFSNITLLVKDHPTSMTEIVEAAKNSAQKGDVILLSAACASFDLFKNYKHRGEEFEKAVRALS